MGLICVHAVSVKMAQEQIREYFAQRFPEWDDIEIHNVQDITSGWETEILSLDISYNLQGKARDEKLIVRIYPGNPGQHRASFEYSLLNAIHDQGFPVPRVLLVETESDLFQRPFIVMERIVGQTMMDHLRNTSEPQFSEMIHLFSRVFVELHQLDWRKLSIVPEEYLHATFSTLIRNHLRGMRDHIMSNEVQFLSSIIDWLEEHLDNIEPLPLALLHRDFHPMNIIIDKSGNPFVIDWTAATIGDPRMDIAWSFLLAKLHLSEDLGDAILNGYQKVIGQDLDNMDFFIVDACLRRLSDITIMLKRGAESLGMRDATINEVKEGITLLSTMHHMIQQIAGLNIEELEEIAKT